MSQSPTQRRDPIKVAIAALGVALVIMAALIAFLVWGRQPPKVSPPPAPVTSATTTPTATATRSTPEPSKPSASVEPTAAATSATAATTSPGTPVATPQVSSAPPAPPVPSSPQTMMWDGKATFTYFTAEVLHDDPDGDDTLIDGKAALPVEVCLTGDLDGSGKGRITSAPWTMEDSLGSIQQPQTGGYQPAFPTSVDVPVGGCVRGYLTFDYVSSDSEGANLVYENGLGDRAVWQFH